MKAIPYATRALNACEQIVLAYNRGGRNGGSVDWNDVDLAYALARSALSAERRQRKRK